MIHSAIVLNSIAFVVSDVKLKIIISPKSDDCGAIVGLPTPLGNLSEMVINFSLTVCLAL